MADSHSDRIEAQLAQLTEATKAIRVDNNSRLGRLDEQLGQMVDLLSEQTANHSQFIEHLHQLSQLVQAQAEKHDRQIERLLNILDGLVNKI
ncbi:MAG: hypothetical protein AAGF24_09370 [Cyanobacteria bacterium P01_H01_bin.121]